MTCCELQGTEEMDDRYFGDKDLPACLLVSSADRSREWKED